MKVLVTILICILSYSCFSQSQGSSNILNKSAEDSLKNKSVFSRVRIYANIGVGYPFVLGNINKQISGVVSLQTNPFFMFIWYSMLEEKSVTISVRLKDDIFRYQGVNLHLFCPYLFLNYYYRKRNPICYSNVGLGYGFTRIYSKSKSETKSIFPELILKYEIGFIPWRFNLFFEYSMLLSNKNAYSLKTDNSFSFFSVGLTYFPPILLR